MIWPFRKRKPEVRDCRIMNEDWCRGDLAECLTSDWVPHESFHPRKGEVLRVIAVQESFVEVANAMMFTLRFEGKPQDCAWDCTCFRKLRPVQAAADQSFTAWLRDVVRRPQLAPVKEPAQ